MAFYMSSISVGTFIDVTVGVQVIIAAVVGGRRTILGGALGAVFLIGMAETLRSSFFGVLLERLMSMIGMDEVLHYGFFAFLLEHLKSGDLANFLVSTMALLVVLFIPGGFLGLLTRSRESQSS